MIPDRSSRRRSLPLLAGATALAIAACAPSGTSLSAASVSSSAQLQGRISPLKEPWKGLGGATVWAGTRQTRTADPSGEGVPAEREFADPRTADQAMTVWHVFQPGNPPELAERRPLQQPRGAEPGDRYVYLRRGEFFFEGLPPGALGLRAEKQGVSSEGLVVQLAPGQRLEGQLLSVPLPLLGESPAVAAWTALTPADGFLVQTGPTARFLGSTTEATLSLRGLPGWPGARLSALSVRFGTGQEPEPPSSTPELRVNFLDALDLAPCPGDGYGPRLDVSLDLNVPLLHRLLKTTSSDFLVARVRFLQEDGTPLPGEAGPLEAEIPLRCYRTFPSPSPSVP